MSRPWLHYIRENYYIQDKVPITNKDRTLKKLGKISKEEAEERLQEYIRLLKIKPIPIGPFDVIYADPPWRYDFSKSNSRTIEEKYPTMDLQDICKLEIPAAKDAVLFLWATAPKLSDALEVIKSWGFLYKTNIVWVKSKIGMGYYFRGRHEILMLATKGSPRLPATADRNDSVVLGDPAGIHSKKPDVIYDLIESAYPNARYIELFARGKHSERWEAWGNEV